MGQVTVMVVGLGDLGARCVHALARLDIDRLVAVSRNDDRADRVAGQAGIVAGLTGGAGQVNPAVGDVSDPDAFASLLRELDPEVIVMSASRHTPAARIVNLAYPDAVGPVLAAEGSAPDLGAGNVAEMAAKVARLAPAGARVSLVAHHATERFAFGAFAALGGAPGGLAGGPPPVLVRVEADGVELPDGRAWFESRHPLLEGREVHAITAAATAGTVAALLSDMPMRIHAPAPDGRPGGYPVLASRAGVTLDLPDGISEAHAIAVNATAARWDGIETIGADGSVAYTRECADAIEAQLGWRLERIAPGELDGVAAELAARRQAALA